MRIQSIVRKLQVPKKQAVSTRRYGALQIPLVMQRAFADKCKRLGVSQAGVARALVAEFLKGVK